MSSKLYDRKSFLKIASEAAAIGALSSQLGVFSFLTKNALGQQSSLSPRTRKRLVFIFLRGGMDGLSVLQPNRNAKLLLNSRKDIIDSSEIKTAEDLINSRLKLQGTEWTLHPAATGLRSLYNNGKLHFIPASGSLNKTRSHFEQQDIIEFGSASRSGFLARTGTLLKLTSTQMVSLSTGNVIAYNCNGLEIDNLECSAPSIIGDLSKLGESKGAKLNPNVSFVDRIQNQWQINGTIAKSQIDNFQKAKADANSKSVADYGFEGLRDASAIICSNPNVGILNFSIGGWDDHAKMGEYHGQYAKRIENLSKGLFKLAEDLEKVGELNNTIIVVMSEFGRRIQSNESKGLDHGRGGLTMVIGGSVKKGITNANLDLSNEKHLEVIESNKAGIATLSDVQVLTDYRSIFSEVLMHHMGIRDLEKIQTIFPGVTPARNKSFLV